MNRGRSTAWISRAATWLAVLSLGCAAFAFASGAFAKPKPAGGSCCSTHGGHDGALADFQGIKLTSAQREQIEAMETGYHGKCGGMCAEMDRVLAEAPSRIREQKLTELQENCAKLRDRHRAAVLKLLPEGDRERYLGNAAKNGNSCRMEKA